MKKNWLGGSLCLHRWPVQKMLLAMKWTFVFTVLLCLNASASLRSQDTKVSLDLKGVGFKKALEMLGKKGNVRFMYTEEMLPVTAGIYRSFKETPVLDAVKKPAVQHRFAIQGHERRSHYPFRRRCRDCGQAH